MPAARDVLKLKFSFYISFGTWDRTQPRKRTTAETQTLFRMVSAIEVWRVYRNRADAENRIKELKYDFGFSSFNLNDFYATEAALTFAMLSYNLMSLFRMFILQSKTQHTLSTLR